MLNESLTGYVSQINKIRDTYNVVIVYTHTRNTTRDFSLFIYQHQPDKTCDPHGYDVYTEFKGELTYISDRDILAKVT